MTATGDLSRMTLPVHLVASDKEKEPACYFGTCKITVSGQGVLDWQIEGHRTILISISSSGCDPAYNLDPMRTEDL